MAKQVMLKFQAVRGICPKNARPICAGRISMKFTPNMRMPKRQSSRAGAANAACPTARPIALADSIPDWLRLTAEGVQKP